jgi:hypothetical protein
MRGHSGTLGATIWLLPATFVGLLVGMPLGQRLK